MKVWMTGCTHFRHEKIISLCQRPFLSIYEHDSHLMNQINTLVKKGDRLYLLGDLGSFKNGEQIKQFRNSINCDDVRMVRGNHDLLTLTAYQKVFQEAGDILEYRWGQSSEEMMVLSHYPMLAWNKSFALSYHCFSHVHGKITPWINHYMPHYRGIDIGVDSAKFFLGEYRPFSLDEVLNILKERKGNSPDRLSCRVISCTKCPSGSYGDSYAITTDFNWGINEAMDNFNFGGKSHHLDVEYPDGTKKILWVPGNISGQFETDGNYGFIFARPIPVNSIITWIR